MKNSSLSCYGDQGENKGHRFFDDMAMGLFPFYCLAFGLLMDAVARIINQPILGTVILLVVGFLAPQSAYYLIAESKTQVETFLRCYTWTDLNTHTIMFALLPILIFESAFSIEAHEFGKHFWEIIILAGPCFLLGFLFLAAWMYVYVERCLQLEKWSFSVCLLYSATISATDPVAVVMLLSKLGVPHRLRLLIEGESLLNDGVAIVLYQMNPLSEIVTRILSVGGSILCGGLCGRLAGWFLGRSKDTLRERAVVMLFVYVTYCLCEASQGSGVLGVVTYALILNGQKEHMSSKSSEDNRKMWQFLAYWANWILFLLTGLMAGQTLHKSTETTIDSIYTFQHLIGIGVWAYVGAFVCRLASLAIYTILTRGMEKLSSHWLLPWSYTVILTWSGLRGSIALLLAMQLADENLKEVSPPALASVTLTVLISNIFHTLTAKYACDRLNLTQLSIAEAMRIRALLESLNHHMKPLLRSYPTMHAYFWSEADWNKVKELCAFEVPPKEYDENAVVVHPEADTTSRLIVMNVMSAYVRALGEREIISTLSVQHIVNAINEAIDRRSPLDVSLLYDQLQPYVGVRKLSACLKNLLDRFENCCSACTVTKKTFIGNNVKLSSDWWQVFCHVVVFGHCALILSTFDYKTPYGYRYERKFQYLLYFLSMLAILLVAEIGIRIWLAREKFRDYLRNRTFWRAYDVFRFAAYILAAFLNAVILKTCFQHLNNVCDDDIGDFTGNFAALDIITLNSSSSSSSSSSSELSVVGGCESNCTSPNFFYVSVLHTASLVPLFSLIFALFWLFYLVPRVLITELHEYTVKADNLTLETLHGIVLLAEHVIQRLAGENRLILQSESLRVQLETENNEMKKEAESKLIALLNVQTTNSRRIAAIKTRHVARVVLSEIRTAVEMKMKSGEIGDHEFQELEKKLIDRIRLTQQLFNSKLDVISFESRLKLIPWIRASKKRKKLIEFIISKAVLKTYRRGQCLIREGDVVDGVYFLMSGICQFYKIVNGVSKLFSLLYSGRFVGEKAFLETKSKNDIQKRSGSVFAATDVTAYFLPSEHAAKILDIDSSVAKKFEEADMATQCKDFLRLYQPYCMWTVPALDGLIQNKWRIIERDEVLPNIGKGASYVLIKGDFEIENQKITPGPKQCFKHDGPMKGIKVFGAENKRCFVLELADDNQLIQSESDSDKTLVPFVSMYGGVQNESKKILLKSSSQKSTMVQQSLETQKSANSTK